MIKVKLLVVWTIGALVMGSLHAGDIRLLVRDAILVTMDPERKEPFVGWFTVGQNGRVLDLGEGTAPADIHPQSTLDASGKLVMPGMISAHSHLWSAPFRGIAADKNLLGWIAAAHTPFNKYYEEGDFYTYTQYGVLDFLAHGITTCYNWVSNNGYPQEYFLEQFEAELIMEQRFIFGWGLDVTKSEEANREDLVAFLKRAEPKQESSNLLRLSISALGLLRGATEFPFWEGRFMKEFGLDAQAHYLEEPSIQEIQREQYPILVEAGLVGPQVMFAHFIHTDDAILRHTAEVGTRMVWNPLSNGRLASGLADIPQYLDRGIPVGMGLDGQASGDLADPFENMRMGLYATRMKYQSAAIMSPYQILALHTLENARVLQVEKDVGSLEVGKFADFIVIDPLSPDVGPFFDIYATIVFVCSTRNMEAVYVGGKVVYQERKFTNHDFAAIRADTYRRVERMRDAMLADGVDAEIWRSKLAHLPRCLGGDCTHH